MQTYHRTAAFFEWGNDNVRGQMRQKFDGSTLTLKKFIT
jgi:hypothetical protein